MKNRNLKPLKSRNQFLKEYFEIAAFSLLMITISVAIGTVGYNYFGKLSWVDSFLNACMILTGMGPVNAMKTDGAKLFASFYSLYSGIAFLTIVSVLFAPFFHRFFHKFHLEIEENEN